MVCACCGLLLNVAFWACCKQVSQKQKRKTYAVFSRFFEIIFIFFLDKLDCWIYDKLAVKYIKSNGLKYGCCLVKAVVLIILNATLTVS